MNKKELPIGVMDSGLGGLSVLREAIKLLPNEDFIYYGDSFNAPYGIRTTEEVKELVFDVVKKLLDMGIKALIIACNTATGAALEDLRKAYPDFPIVGIEPAIETAVSVNKGGRIIAIATPRTVAQDNFLRLMEKYKDTADIKAIGCPGLMDFVERGDYSKQEIFEYLDEHLKPELTENTESIVLGCTHYPFLKDEIFEYVGNPDLKLIDGSKVTCTELIKSLKELDIETSSDEPGSLTIMNSSPDEKYIEKSFELLDKEF